MQSHIYQTIDLTHLTAESSGTYQTVQDAWQLRWMTDAGDMSQSTTHKALDQVQSITTDSSAYLKPHQCMIWELRNECCCEQLMCELC